MEKKQAQEYIKQVLNSRFDQEQFELFVRNLLNEFEPRDNSYSGNLIPEAFRDHIAHYKRIGKYTDPEGEPMDILIVQTRSVNKLERTRTALRNFVVRHLKNFDKYYALVAFYSKEDDGTEWRLSLVKIDIEQERTEKGKIKAKEEIVPAKRFSFLVGENENAHTSQKQLLPLLVNDHSNPLIIKEKDGDGSVEGAFSIEKVTDEFYEQYKELYLKLTENAALTETLEKEGLDPVRFVKKLLGQIVFIYFLQKKGWLGVPKDQKMGEGPKNFLRKKFDEINENGGSYFNDFLRFLFYDALAKEHNDEGIKYFNKNLGCKIPFLNGGLFEADYENWDTLDLNIDNTLFSNPNEKTKAGDKGTGILDVFDRYNFTIREDEPLEKEVAVDPEMLGKVFENLLDVTDRKSKGAFYTPREIVHYMCQQSLIHYLDNTVNHYTESYQSIDSDQTNLFGGSSDKKGNLKIELENKGNILIQKEHIERYIRESTTALENDEDYFEAQERIERGEIKSTDKKLYLDKSIYLNAEKLDQALVKIKICDPAIGSGAFPVGLLHELVSARKVLRKHLSKRYLEKLDVEDITDLTDYYYKRHAIQESIYGVDIDPSAIDIARLRLWLSMIVDEEDYDTIEALPNLDYKIVCGNSLVGFPSDWKSQAFDKIENLKEEFFSETDQSRKKELKEDIDWEIQERLKSSQRVFGYEVDFDFKLFFSEVWHYKKGFDIVIGNPPYGLLNKKQNQNFSIRVNAEHLNFFKTALDYRPAKGGVINVFRLFIAKSGLLLNPSGIFSQIFPLAYTGDVTSKAIRDFTLNKFRILGIEAFPERDNENTRVFKHAKMSVCILFFTKKSPPTNKFYLRTHWDKYVDNSNERIELSQLDIETMDPEYMTIPILSKSELRVLQKVYSRCKRVSDYTNCYTGEIDLSLDKKYLRSDDTYNTLLKGAIIGRYEIRKKMSQGEILFLDSNEYLKKNKGKRATHYKLDRIGMQGITGVNERMRLKMSLIPSGVFLANSVNYIIMPGGKVQNKLVLLQLNSELHNYIFKLSSTNSNVNGYEINNLPIVANSEYSLIIATLVDYLIFLCQIKEDYKLDFLFAFYDSVASGISYELHFPEEIQSANKQILPHLGDLKPITDEMSDEEKLAIIQSEFERLYDPNHPVRNNLETLDSVEEVRIIKEALK